MVAQLPSLVSPKILMAIHAAGWSYGLTCTDFHYIGKLCVVVAIRYDGRGYVAHAETELALLSELWGMLVAADETTNNP